VILTQQLILGLLVGGLYGLAAAGLSLTFGVLRVLNVAHGELLMLGGYGAFWLFTLWRIDPFVSLLAIGPAMYVFGRGNSLSRALDRIQVGDSVETVVTKMGRPQEDAHANLYLHGDSEYRYTSWPLSGTWIVSFKDGKVLEKAQR